MYKGGRYSEQVAKGAGVLTATVVEYACRETIELAINVAVEAKKASIIPVPFKSLMETVRSSAR